MAEVKQVDIRSRMTLGNVMRIQEHLDRISKRTSFGGKELENWKERMSRHLGIIFLKGSSKKSN